MVPGNAHEPSRSTRAGVAQLVEQLIRNQQVTRSSRVAGSNIIRSIPERQVTLHSGDMGNSFGPKGLSIGSSRHVSSISFYVLERTFVRSENYDRPHSQQGVATK